MATGDTDKLLSYIKIISPYAYVIAPGDLLPEARKKYDALLSAGNAPPAIFIDPQRDYGDHENLSVRQMPEVASYILASESVHRWTEERAKAALPPYAVISSAKTFQNKAITELWQKMARDAHLSPVPRLLEITHNAPYAESAVTRDNVFYVRVSSYLSAETEENMRMARTIFSHELGHFLHGDLTPAAIAARHNDESHRLEHAAENAADENAILLCQGREGAALKRTSLDYVTAQANQYHMPLREWEMYTDPKHPLLEDRIAHFVSGAAREEKNGRCPPPEPPPTVPNCKAGSSKSCERQ